MYYRKNKLSILAIAATLISSSCFATNDEIRGRDGQYCRSSNEGNLKVYSELYSNEGNNSNYYGENSPWDDQGVKIGVSYSFGGGKRLDCSKLYDQELERGALELEQLRAEVARLKKLTALQNGYDSGMIPPPKRTE